MSEIGALRPDKIYGNTGLCFTLNCYLKTVQCSSY